MSHNRSSDVRSLRAMFENQDSTVPDARGRSPNGHAPGERPLSKVRSNFVSVEPRESSSTRAMDIDIEKTKAQHEDRHSTASFRREEFSLDESKDSDAIAELKRTVSQESERRASHPQIYPETIPEAAIEATPALETPAVEAKDYLAAGELQYKEKTDSRDEEDVHAVGSKLKEMTLPSEDLPAENPDKPISAAQEDPGPMQPSDPKEQTTIGSSPTDTESVPTQQKQTDGTTEPAPSSSQTPTTKHNTPTPAPDTRARRASIIAPGETSVLSGSTRRGSMATPAPAKAPPSPDASGSTARPRRGSIIAPGEASLPEEPSARRESIMPDDKKDEPVESVAVTPAESQVVSPAETPTAIANEPAPSEPAPPTTPPASARKPAATATAPTPPKSASSTKSSAKSSTLSPRAPVRKPSRNSLAAPTASSQAKAAAAAKAATSSKAVPAPRASSRPAKVPSHLTAPTASSVAKQDAHAAAAKPTTMAKPPPPTSQRQSRPSMNGSRPAPRTSVARPPSDASKKPEPRPARAPDDSFLARMMRPTASSANKVHDKTDVKSPPRRTPSVLKKATTKPKTPKFEKAEPKANGTAASDTEQKSEDAAAGVSTPQTHDNGQETPSNTGLEATPAFDAETIR